MYTVYTQKYISMIVMYSQLYYIFMIVCHKYIIYGDCKMTTKIFTT